MRSISMEWRSIPLAPKELNLGLTLSSGQAFRWVKGEEGEWSGSIGERLYILHHHGDVLEYQVATPTTTPVEDRRILEDYFRLDVDLSGLYTLWSEDQNFREKVSWCQGIRLLRQPFLETLITFICSANNHLTRISAMVTSFCEMYGEYLGNHRGNKFHSFPHLNLLVGVVSEAALRDLGFGYRAQYVKGSLEEIERRGGEAWLSSLLKRPYCEARTELQQLPGVGAKVADCVCLMGLGHLQAVPVDVHVRRLAHRDYGVGGAGGSLTPAVYNSVGDKFRNVFGATAGWAQSVLFTAELQQQSEGQGRLGGRKRQRKGRGGGRQDQKTDPSEPLSKRSLRPRNS